MKVLIAFAILAALTTGTFDAYTVANGNENITANAPVLQDFVLFSSVKVKPESILQFKETVLPYAEQTREEDGCIEYRVHQSPDDPTQFETYEHWRSDADRSSHLAAAYTVQFFKTVTPLFEAGYPMRQKFIELR